MEKSIAIHGPYKNEGLNYIYQLLFCDSLDLYKVNKTEPHSYPYDILFSAKSKAADLQKIIDDTSAESRIKELAYKRQAALGYKPLKKELLGVIIEVHLKEGLDVLASFSDGTARYINHSESMIVLEARTGETDSLIADLFAKGANIVKQIGPWDKPRRPHPSKETTRISFLVSGDLYFGEGPTNYFFNDPLAKPALESATALMMHLMEKSSKSKNK